MTQDRFLERRFDRLVGEIESEMRRMSHPGFEGDSRKMVLPITPDTVTDLRRAVRKAGDRVGWKVSTHVLGDELHVVNTSRDRIGRSSAETLGELIENDIPRLGNVTVRRLEDVSYRIENRGALDLPDSCSSCLHSMAVDHFEDRCLIPSCPCGTASASLPFSAGSSNDGNDSAGGF